MDQLDPRFVQSIVAYALAEDLGPGDVTTNAVASAQAQAVGRIVVRQEGVVAGLPVARAVFAALADEVVFTARVEDGARVKAGNVIGELAGPARALLSGERVALNFLQRLSGVATFTRRCVDAVAGTSAKVLDTRKTTPGLRLLEKYAVRVGGGMNHRFGLYDQVLIKDNHIRLAGGSIRTAVLKARALTGGRLAVEVEAETLPQVREALESGADIIMLDNMTDDAMREAVALVRSWPLLPGRPRPQTEASGGLTLARLPAVAALGVDRLPRRAHPQRPGAGYRDGY